MQVLITGALGFIGRHLTNSLLAEGHEVIGLLHRRAPPESGSQGVVWLKTLQDLPETTRIDAVVNLAGAPILGPPWTQRRRQLLLASRLDTTLALVSWIDTREQRPTVLVSASAIGWYGTRDDTPLDETASPTTQFQSQLCQQWEAAATEAQALGVRVVCLRFGVVLGGDGGALPLLAQPVRLGAGAILGSGRQGAPWIHIDDAVGLIRYALDASTLQGAVNAVAPGHVTHAGQQRALAQLLRRPLLLRIPAFVLRALLGEMAQLLVDGQHVVPTRALAAGYRFRYPELTGALRAALGET